MAFPAPLSRFGATLRDQAQQSPQDFGTSRSRGIPGAWNNRDGMRISPEAGNKKREPDI